MSLQIPAEIELGDSKQLENTPWEPSIVEFHCLFLQSADADVRRRRRAQQIETLNRGRCELATKDAVCQAGRDVTKPAIGADAANGNMVRSPAVSVTRSECLVSALPDDFLRQQHWSTRARTSHSLHVASGSAKRNKVNFRRSCTNDGYRGMMPYSDLA